jgi:hypothetical protein
MKIEVDLTQPIEGLTNTKAELEVALNAVVGALALAVLEKKRAGLPIVAQWNPDWKPLGPDGYQQVPGTIATGATVIMAMKGVFTMREARDAAKASGVTEQRVRNEVARQIKQGRLEEIEKGKGRTPSSFRKLVRG